MGFPIDGANMQRKLRKTEKLPRQLDAVVEFAMAELRAMQSGLSIREARLVANYAECVDITEAALKAGYAERTAREEAKQWLDPNSRLYKPKLHSAIKAKQEAIAAAIGIHVYDLVSELKNVVFTDILELFEADGSAKAIDAISPSARMVIAKIDQSVTVSENGDRITRTKIKLRDRDAAIDKLMRYLGGYEYAKNVSAQLYVVLATPAPPGAQGPQTGTSVTESNDPRARNLAMLEATNEWIVENGLDDPIVIYPE
jgi:phage terminase small subunit